MRLHLHRPAAPHRAAVRRPCQLSLAELWLGAGHPLVRSLRRSEIAGRQLVTVSAVQAAGVVAAGCPGAPPLLSYPLADRRVIRAVAPELRQVAALLRGEPAVRGVALVEWLLTSPATPLYDNEVAPLRQELGRARYLMAPG